MRFELLTATAGPDGTVNFSIKGEPGRVYEVVVTVAEKEDERGVFHTPTPEENGYSREFVENVLGSIDDDMFVEPPDGPPPPAVRLGRD